MTQSGATTGHDGQPPGAAGPESGGPRGQGQPVPGLSEALRGSLYGPDALGAVSDASEAPTGALAGPRAPSLGLARLVGEPVADEVATLLPRGLSEGALRVAAAFLVRQRSATTKRAYATDLRAFAGWCAAQGLDLLEVEEHHLERWRGELATRPQLLPRRRVPVVLSDATIARRLSTLSEYYRRAVRLGELDRNPVDDVRRPPTGKDDSPRLGLDKEQARALLAAAATAGPRDHALACLFVLNGLRVSEAVGVSLEDLAERRGHHVVSIVRKGGARHNVPLAPRTASAVGELLAARGATDDPHLFLDVDGRPMDRFDAARMVRRLARRAGIVERISPHSLRHTFVTAALDAEVPLRDVQDAAGHADPRTTRRYDRGRHSLDRHATYAVARYLG